MMLTFLFCAAFIFYKGLNARLQVAHLVPISRPLIWAEAVVIFEHRLAALPYTPGDVLDLGVDFDTAACREYGATQTETWLRHALTAAVGWPFYRDTLAPHFKFDDAALNDEPQPSKEETAEAAAARHAVNAQRAELRRGLLRSLLVVFLSGTLTRGCCMYPAGRTRHQRAHYYPPLFIDGEQVIAGAARPPRGPGPKYQRITDPHTLRCVENPNFNAVHAAYVAADCVEWVPLPPLPLITCWRAQKFLGRPQGQGRWHQRA